MSEAKHTPGPWKESPYKGGSAPDIPIMVGTECIASVHHLGRSRNAEWLANAKLIAAAPEMLAALEAFMSCDPMRNLLGGSQHVIDMAQSAIKKATA